jgi:exoribonuclease R
MAKKSTEQLTSQQWLPSVGKSNDDIFASDSEREQLEHDSIELVANIISMRINDNDKTNIIDIDEKDQSNPDNNTQQIKDDIVRNRFRDLTCKDTGENILEDMFLDHASTTSKESRELDVLRGSIIAMQSLLIMGMQVGVKGSLEMQQRMVAHLYRNKDVTVKSSRHVSLQKYFDDLTPRQLKHQVDTTAGTQILSNLKRKRSAQGAFDLLVQLGVWDKHEDIALLRSGFPLRFTDEEINDAIQAETEGGIENLDPDELLGLRQDFRSMKVYTIDSEFTSEIDDGLSIESITKKDGSQRNRIWVHIADADKWGMCFFIIFSMQTLGDTCFN